jgi:predicted class III extradiol MEMO1 family dioxygenase
MGQYFGDKEKLTPKLMEQIAERDRQYLELIEKQDKAGLFAHIAEDGDARKICGYPSVYLLLDILENLKIKSTITCIDYQQAVNYKNDCAVTFAGLKIEVINKIHRQAVS